MTTRKVASGHPDVAVAYLRASTNEQHLSVPAQRACIRAWSACEHVVVVGWYADRGVCSVTPIERRPALRAALDALGAQGAGVLVVARRDRIARDVVLASEIERAAGRAGARLVSAAGEGNGDSPGDAFLRTVIDGAAQYERGMIRARTRAALAAKRARRELVGAIPYGFALRSDGVHLMAARQEQATIARARHLRARACRSGRSQPSLLPRDVSAVEDARFCRRRSRACWPFERSLQTIPAGPDKSRSSANWEPAFPERHPCVSDRVAPTLLSLAPKILNPIHHFEPLGTTPLSCPSSFDSGLRDHADHRRHERQSRDADSRDAFADARPDGGNDEGDADDDRMRGEGGREGSGDHGIAINVVNLTSYPQRAKASWNHGAP